MKIITQLNLFEDQELGDLEKILMVLDGLPEDDWICLSQTQTRPEYSFSQLGSLKIKNSSKTKGG
ncbi:TPA: hypothetical protein ACGOTL_002203, partial [Streptococcus suis]